MLEVLISEGLEQLGLSVHADSARRCRLYYDYLTQMNQVMNLTAIEGESDAARLHFLDSAALLTLNELGSGRVIDIGSGAGFPGLALKIFRPELELTLLDSLDKRVGFLRESCDRLGFGGLDCVHARAEEPPEGFRESFDAAVSRAVARLNTLCELCLPYVKPGGVFIAMKGADCLAELNEAESAIHTLGGRLERKADYRIPGTDIVHSAVVIRKEGRTPAKYPRRWAQIKKTPL